MELDVYNIGNMRSSKQLPRREKSEKQLPGSEKSLGLQEKVNPPVQHTFFKVACSGGRKITSNGWRTAETSSSSD